MAKFNGFVGQVTPVIATTNFNWNLGFSSTLRATVQETVLGGYASSSTPMQTAIYRTTSGGTTAPAAGNVARLDQTLTTAGNAANFYANAAWSTGPTLAAGALFGTAWNSYGGVVRWLAAPGEEWDLALSATAGIVCSAQNGTGVSSYSVVWTEF